MTTPADVARIYAKAVMVAGKYPYAYGGGHNPSFAPSDPTVGNGPAGYDCSAFVDMLLHAGAPDEMPTTPGTHELERWGLEGFGQYLAVRVFNGVHKGVIVEHALLEFREGFPPEHRYAMAHFTGGPLCGFVADADFDPSFYHARRKTRG